MGLKDQTKRLAAMASVCLGFVVGAAAQQPPPLEDFFSAAAMNHPVLSPDGKHVAVHLNLASGRRVLAVLKLDALQESRIVAGFQDADIATVQWVNNERLVFSITDLGAAWRDLTWPGLFAVDRTGDRLRPLVNRKWDQVKGETGSNITSRELSPNHSLLRTLRDGSDDVVVERLVYDSQWRELVSTTALRLNTVTGRTSSLSFGAPPNTFEWFLDSQGQAHWVQSIQGDHAEVFHKPAGSSEWKSVGQFGLFGARVQGRTLRPWRMGPANELYVLQRKPGPEGTDDLYRYDEEKQTAFKSPLVSLKGFDFEGSLVNDETNKKLLGIHYQTDGTGTVWFDLALRAVQQKVDQQLPGLINHLDVPECNCTPWVLVSSYSDKQPTVYSLYHRENNTLGLVGAQQPKIKAAQMAERDFSRFPARDGMSIPVYVTRPKGKGPWPTVVLVHGGPFVRGSLWAWDAESQFLASRGYLVVEPEFRGSQGYGWRLFEAGWKQWGLKMQDDVADATRWAVAQGLADAKRMCILGSSYGGYAAMMGLVNDPELYRCGVSMAGVTDIGLLYSISWSDLPETWRRFGMPRLIGDPVADAAQLLATSAVKQAARINRPVLLLYGGEDRRVPITHGTQLRDALKAANKDVEWLVYNNEGHGFFKPENRYTAWAAIESFLAKQLLNAPTH